MSAPTAWKLEIKRRLGKLTALDDLLDTISEQGFTWLPIAPEHA